MRITTSERDTIGKPSRLCPYNLLLADRSRDWSFFTSPDGTEIWNAFHAENQFPQGSCGNARYTMAERVYFNETGDPVFERAMRLSMEQTAPSGESNSTGPTPSSTSTAATSSSTSTAATPSRAEAGYSFSRNHGLEAVLFTVILTIFN